MWGTMILPLFNPILLLMHFEPGEINQLKAARMWVRTFKRFMMIPKNTDTWVVSEMIGRDFVDLINTNLLNAKEKWTARMERRDPITVRPSSINYLKGVSNDWCEIIRQQCRLCQICRNSTRNSNHMERVHNVDILSFKDIWDDIKGYNLRKMEELKKKKKKDFKAKFGRKNFIEFWKQRLHDARELFQEKLDGISI